jgi:hypothetical protein
VKYFLIFALLLFTACGAMAEEQNLLGGKLVHGGYGAPVVKFTHINGKFAALAGGQGQWIINHTLALGGGCYGLASEQDYASGHDPSMPQYPGFHTTFSYGGAIISYIGESDQMLHPTFDLLIGGGSVDLIDRNAWDEHRDYAYSSYHDGVFVLEPSINAELNIVRFMRADVGVSFRLVSGVSRFGYDNSDFSGVSGNVTLKFGKF